MLGPILALLCATATALAQPAAEEPEASRVRHVPREHATIQAAIDAAEDGDTVLVSPGVYREGLRMGGKTIHLASHFVTTGDARRIEDTVLDGQLGDGATASRRDQVILIERSVGPASRIVGFTIRGGDDGISCYGSLAITNNRFINNVDAIDYEGGGGLCRDNLFEENEDDAVDFDLATAAEVSYNIIRNNKDDGIEIRLHDHRGDNLDIIICNNLIRGNGEDGIQIIGYPRLSNRRIHIERNVIAHNAMAGIGCMPNGITKENYEGAAIAEPILVVNNTIVENEIGICGGRNLTAVNNLLVSSRMAALKNVGGHSVVRRNLLWRNGADAVKSNFDAGQQLTTDPRLDAEFGLQPGSPCIDAGLDEFPAPWGPFELDPATVIGEMPDLGAFEFSAAGAPD
jgi:hypothetical protein